MSYKTPPRFRSVKSKTKRHRPAPNSSPNPSPYRNVMHELFIARRLKACLVDVFMIYTPIVYIAYWILGGAQDFRQNQPAIFICFLVYAAICALFIAISGQTPGLRYARLRLVLASSSSNHLEGMAGKIDETSGDSGGSGAGGSEAGGGGEASRDGKDGKVGFWRAFARVFVWGVSCALVVGFIAPFLSRRHAFLHDVYLGTRIIAWE